MSSELDNEGQPIKLVWGKQKIGSHHMSIIDQFEPKVLVTTQQSSPFYMPLDETYSVSSFDIMGALVDYMTCKTEL